MALPSGVTSCTLTVGTYFDAIGGAQPSKMTITPVFGPFTNFITWTASGESMVATEVSGEQQPDGSWSATVAVVNQSGWTDETGSAFSNWTYLVKWEAGGKQLSKMVSPVTGQTLIDVDKVPGGTAGTPTTATVPPVTSVGGFTGGVTAEQLQSLGLGGGTLATIPAGVALATDDATRPSSRSDLVCIFTNATPDGSQLTGDAWLKA